jgi:hypothetical protein
MTIPKDLEFWDVLPKHSLKACVTAAGKEQLASMTPQEQQLYDAARNRLLTWKEPLKRRGKEKMIDDTETTVTQTEPEHPAPEAKPVRKAPAKRAAPAAADAAEKESTVAKRAKKAGKSSKKTVVKAKKANSGNGVSRIPLEAKITWTGKENPFKEGSGAFDRTELVRKASGKTHETIGKLKGIRSSTLRTLLNMELIRVS